MKYNYLHIINGEIESMVERHPLENFSDKTKFIDLLKKDLNIDVVDDISDKKKNLFRVYYKDLYYNIFVEMTDGGGKDISYNKTIKKVAIPYHTKAFNKIIENYERVLVINIYVPLDQNKQPDYSKRVYLIVDPNEIYSSNVVKERTKNSSSRWVSLEKMIEVINGKDTLFLTNKKENVFVVFWDKIQLFFDQVLKEKYISIFRDSLTKIIPLSLDEDDSVDQKTNYQKYRRIFKENLISDRGIKCEISNCKINIPELMIGSHIKPVNEIKSDKKLSEEEKNIQISDTNNGFLLCPTHDALFDKFLITFDNNGVLKISKSIWHKKECLDIVDGQMLVKIRNNKMLRYLKFHNYRFSKKEKNLKIV